MRVEKLAAAFAEHFPDSGRPGVCRAPGRVNLLGEHVDYNGLPVLPMTLDREIRLAFRAREDDRIRLSNTAPAFPRTEFRNGPDIPPSAPGSWANYCKAAVQGLNRHVQPVHFLGMDLLVDGTIPVAAGLSSSSALVVASALAYLACLDKKPDTEASRVELAGLLAAAEHYVGTLGGGMDQAVILLGQEGAACKIDFFPLRVETVPLFDEHVFVLCHSLVKADKTGAAQHRYNEGPSLSRLIRALVERRARHEFGEEVVLDHLIELWSGPLCLTNPEVAALFAQTFPKPATTLEEAAAFLGLTIEEIRSRWLGDLEEPPGGFPLEARARHQLTEYLRVETGRDLLLAGDARGFGALMNASHESCAHDYRVSCPELDSLVQTARQLGSLGSRLTGAGFGGYTVHLVETAHVETFCERIADAHYRARRASRGDAPPLLSDPILLARTSKAAGFM